MERPILNNKDEYPDDTVLLRYLAETKDVWDAFLEFIRKDHPSIAGEWRYYNDGKSWLFKVTKKAQTICWVSVRDGFFKATFYFGDKAEELILSSLLDKTYKDQFRDGKKYGKIRGITVEVKKASDLEAVRQLMAIKEKIK